jgi:hypothetical protein
LNKYILFYLGSVYLKAIEENNYIQNFLIYFGAFSEKCGMNLSVFSEKNGKNL